jgi:DNA repair ATPase RecN
MKIKSLTIKNIGIIPDQIIEINKPLTLFYGDIKQGKTTILNCVRWCFGGSFPKDIIRHGESEGLITLLLDNGSISRSFYVNKEGETVSRPQTIIINNQSKQVKDLKMFLNPFLLKQSYLEDLKDNERPKYILELFDIDTTEIDNKILTKETEASNLRAKIKGYGEINSIPVEKPDFEILEAEKKKIQNSIDEQKSSVAATNSELKSKWNAEKQKALEEIIKFNNEQKNLSKTIENANTLLGIITKSVLGTILEKCFDVDCAKRTIEALPKPVEEKLLIVNIPEPTYAVVDTCILTEIDQKINEAKIQQVKYESYLKDKTRQDAKAKDQSDLKNLELSIKELRQQKLLKLSEINGKIEGLEANEKGLFFENTSFDMLSTSQIMNLSSQLSSFYPEGFGIELIDHGESLGKSIFEFVKRAEKEEKTILATIVGEKPAIVPENIGVFVIENGKLM